MLPRRSALSDLGLIDIASPSLSPPPADQELPSITPDHQDDVSPVIIGAGLPPVPGRLVKRIRDGQFIEMGELLPEHLGMATVTFEVSNILEWLQFFRLYIAIISQSQPERVPNLQGYQTLIIQTSMEYNDNRWMGYD